MTIYETLSLCEMSQDDYREEKPFHFEPVSFH